MASEDVRVGDLWAGHGEVFRVVAFDGEDVVVTRLDAEHINRRWLADSMRLVSRPHEDSEGRDA